jgi:UMF1 family MFS transporter
VTGSFRKGVLSIAAFFLIGLVILAKVNVRRGAREAGNEPPTAG